MGDYITLCKRKNKNLESTNLIGVAVEKEIIPSLNANKNTNLSICWIVEKGDFVVSLIQVGRDGKLPICLYTNPNIGLVSPSYRVFRLNNSLLENQYLMIYLKSTKIDEQAVFFAGGGVRDTLSWNNFSQIPIFVPPLDFQKRVVYKYQIVEKLIKTKRRVNELLEKWMTAYYHILFDNLTDYTTKSFGELFTIIRGGRPPRGNKEQDRKYFCKEGGIPWLQVKDVTKQQCKFPQHTSEQLTKEGFKRGKCKVVPAGSVVVVGSGVNAKALGFCMVSFCDLILNTTLWGIIGNILLGGGIPIPATYIYFLIKENVPALKRMINASTERVSFDVKSFTSFEVKFPSQSLIDRFNSFCEPIFELQKQNEQTITKLERMQKCWIESLR